MSPELAFAVVPLTEVPIPEKIAEVERQQRVVLVVDDERVIADTLSVILSRSGFCVLTAYDASSALELARGVAPDLLLSDVMMGTGMDGVGLAVEMVKAYPECKVLLFSGNAATADLLVKAREEGHNFTLMTKPVHPRDLLRRIGETFGVKAANQAMHSQR